jgi:hypothetical protein
MNITVNPWREVCQRSRGSSCQRAFGTSSGGRLCKSASWVSYKNSWSPAAIGNGSRRRRILLTLHKRDGYSARARWNGTTKGLAR